MSGAKKRKAPGGNSAQSAADEILHVCSAPTNSLGVAQDDLEAALANVPKEVLLEALNSLIKRGKLVPCPGVNGKILFRIQSDEVAAKFHGLSAEDRLVYQEVERAGSSGISTRDLCMHTSLQHPQLTKVLKMLETRKLVRPVKSHAAKNKKMYILYDLEASKEITGGAFYSGQDFDHELIIQLQQHALSFIAKEEGANAQKVHEFISKCGLIVGKPLALSDIVSVLDTLVYDGRVEKTRDAFARSGDTVIYRVAHSMSSIDLLVRHYTSVPVGCECLACTTNSTCGVCPTISAWLDQACSKDTFV
ncbi:hypothetical protein AB1Y20_006767 [Prymnesium parvum]|uniref:DNA-directed RNA polymerase III subunit RPC6 n=1 Tax=Prymnesium parvum TaxID=97485 RepID=A0AB34J1L9_PRYPA